MKTFPKFTPNKTLTALLLLGVTFSVITIVNAISLVPNPGHDISTLGGYGATGDILYGTDGVNGGVSSLTGAIIGNALLSGGTATVPSWGKVGLTTHVSGILPTANGGTGMAFFNVSGPTVSRTFAFPDAAATVLTSNTPVTVAQGGTGLATLTANNVLLGNGATAPTFVAPGTASNLLQSNGTKWVSGVGGVLIGVQTLTSGTTYTPTASTTKAVIELWGGGGAGGSCTAAAGCAAGGGGSGGYAKYYFSAVGAGPYTIAIGGGGAAVGGGTGGVGTATTFNTGVVTITANGGAGGTTAAGTTAGKFTAGGAGGAISTLGTINGAGMRGAFGTTATGTVLFGASGGGGSTALGGGGVGIIYSSAASVAGIAAVANTGSGGGGCGTGQTSSGSCSGGAGAAGRIIIQEFR